MNDADHTLWLSGLPTILATSFVRLEQEVHPVVKLWRVVDTAELALRLVVAIAVCQLEGELPGKVRDRICRRIDRPTLGCWMNLARALAPALPNDSLVPELHSSIEEVLVELFYELAAERAQEPESSILGLRNYLAHALGVSHVQASGLLEKHLGRLEVALRRLDWLSEIHLIAAEPDGSWTSLRGPSPTLFVGSQEAHFLGAEMESGSVVCLRGTKHVTLWPLHAYGPPSLQIRGQEQALEDESAVLVYFRREKKRLQMAALGSSVAVAELWGPAFERFSLLFPAPTCKKEEDPFVEELQDEGMRLVGREQIVAQVIDSVNRQTGCVLWLYGAPGMGKSAVMARVAVELWRETIPERLVVAWRFRAGDPRCSEERFLRHAVIALERWPMLGTSKTRELSTVDHARHRLGQLLEAVGCDHRVIFLLDGMDEIARSQPAALELPFRYRTDQVVWLCAGRPESKPSAAFSPDRPGCVHVFVRDGLPPLTEAETSEWLKREAPSLQRDAIVRAEIEGETARWVRTVTRRSGGLPQYIALLLEELGRDLFVGQPVPKGLAAYFERIVDAMGGDDVGLLVPLVLAVAALSVEAPTDNVIVAVLRRSGVLKPETSDKHLADVTKARGRAQNLLRVVQESGEYRHMPYHDELTAWLALSDNHRNSRQHAIEGWISLIMDPVGEDEAVMAECLAIGLRQLVVFEQRESLLSIFAAESYHRERFQRTGRAGRKGLIADIDVVHAALRWDRDKGTDYIRFLEHMTERATMESILGCSLERALQDRNFLGYVLAFRVRLGSMLRRLGQLDRARTVLEDAIQLTEMVNEPVIELLRERAVLEYELGYIRYLCDDLKDAQYWMWRSVKSSEAGGDAVWAEISRCIHGHFELRANRITPEDFIQTLRAAREVFMRERWHPYAESWVMNSVANEFDTAADMGDLSLAQALLVQLERQPWVRRYGKANLVVETRRGRLALACGDFARAVEVLEDALEGICDDEEELARWLYYLGAAYGESGHSDAAVAAFERALALPSFCANDVWKRRISDEVARILETNDGTTDLVELISLRQGQNDPPPSIAEDANNRAPDSSVKILEKDVR